MSAVRPPARRGGLIRQPDATGRAVRLPELPFETPLISHEDCGSTGKPRRKPVSILFPHPRMELCFPQERRRIFEHPYAANAV